MVAIIDYGAGNLRSVANAVTRIGYSPNITSNPQDLLKADAVMLPGVGAAGDTMRALAKLGMLEALRQIIAEDRPLFAICIGLQVMFSGTEEGGWHEGLGIFPGRVRRFPDSELKIPHMGWNEVRQKRRHPVFEGIPDKAHFYFVHSYYATPEQDSIVAGTTDYGLSFCSMIARGNLVATQFHPEKSGEIGLQMYANFLKHAVGPEGRSSLQC